MTQGKQPLPIETYQPRTALIDMLKEKAPALYESVMARRRLENPEQYPPTTPSSNSSPERNYTPIDSLIASLNTDIQEEQASLVAEEEFAEYQMQIAEEEAHMYEEEPLPWE